MLSPSQAAKASRRPKSCEKGKTNSPQGFCYDRKIGDSQSRNSDLILARDRIRSTESSQASANKLRPEVGDGHCGLVGVLGMGEAEEASRRGRSSCVDVPLKFGRFVLSAFCST